MTHAATTRRELPAGEGLVEIDGASCYCVPDIDQMNPFLISIVSDGDRWMYVSSSGALTAGRIDASSALFPYETDDRLHQAGGLVGPVTAIRVAGESPELWTPFRQTLRRPGRRFLYKSVVGSSIIFEEVHPDWNLRFRYRWTSSDRFGFVRTATLINDGDQPAQVELVDGLLNVLPHGLDPAVYQSMSNLTNAYKRSEVIDTNQLLAVYTLESRIMDRPEPAESLRGSSIWSVGLSQPEVSLSPDSLAEFENLRSSEPAKRLTGRPGAYLLRSTFNLNPGDQMSWHIVADVAQDQIAVGSLRNLFSTEIDLNSEIEESVRQTAHSLHRIMAPADAQQMTGDEVATAHQFVNVTYNVMRGGIPLTGYQISTSDFVGFVRERNSEVAVRHQTWLDSLPQVIERNALLEQIRRNGDVHLIRLGLEYLPFSFSRRHGDPSRPWNAFSIRVRDADGQPTSYYEGNWRDIFQNWEALCASFPEYLPSVISVFVNASTPDGFNPYRITRHGIDWEVPDPDDPWSNIGYWGDHQIVYLLRLLEAAEKFLPGEIAQMLGERRFTFADVPYRLASYESIVKDPKATIDYDHSAAYEAMSRVTKLGDDGRLLSRKDGEPYLVTLIEKLVISALTKLSNFVPGGGIWMNTQRPEWNDANNALVGFGLSMVTLFHLRRYLDHLRALVRQADIHNVEISREVANWLISITDAFRSSDQSASGSDNRERRVLVDQLGTAFSEYRSRIYEAGFSSLTAVTLDDIAELCDLAIEHLDCTIRDSRRPDGLYHSYNLIHFGPDDASVTQLHEMLEGQVAVLGSGVLSPEERADVIDALFASGMYRPDQRSFMLYPARDLPSFLEKNVVLPESVEANPLLSGLLEAGEPSVVAVDSDGHVRFNPNFTNRDDLEAAVDRVGIDPTWGDLVASHREATLRAYEQVFQHHAYTGRSGSMYGYEGIGSIFWHMVAKLLVTVQDSVVDAVASSSEPATIERLVNAYWSIRSGLGFNKTAREFGAIPLDPYSHTPAHAGAQQPGMTGLVKEELLARPLEVGIRVESGEIIFDPVLLRRDELLPQPISWRFHDLTLEPRVIELGEDSLGMTLCQVPIVVSATDGNARIEVVLADGTTTLQPGLHVDSQTSAEVFARSGRVQRIHAHVPDSAIRAS